jgi:hypothetical protein
VVDTGPSGIPVRTSRECRGYPASLFRTEKELYDLLLDFVSSEERKGRAGSYIESTLKAIKSWLAHNGVRLARRIKIRDAQATPTLVDERTPTQEELRKVLLAARSRARVACVLMAHSGLRPEVLGNYYGTDGLRLKDVVDLRVSPKGVEFERKPAMIMVRPELSKARHRYFTFLSEEGCEYLRDYLEERIREGEALGPDSDIIAHRDVEGKPFMRTMKVSSDVKKAIQTAGFAWRPYVLRAYFDTQLLVAESKGKVAHDFRVFWMGHKGSMEARYTTNKGRLPHHLTDEMREAYTRCEPFLASEGAASREEVPLEVARSMLDLAGYTEEEIETIDLGDKEKVRDLVRERMGASPGGPKQEVIDANELPARLAQGWSYVDKLNDRQVVVTSPATGGTSPTPATSPPSRPSTSGPALPPARSGGDGTQAAVPPPASISPGRPRSPQPTPKATGRWDPGIVRPLDTERAAQPSPAPQETG